jgi:methionyl-tRNA synthetase
MITFDEFAQLDLRVGIVTTVELVPKSTHLLKLTVNIGEESPRTIMSGIADQYTPEDLVNRKIVVLTNLQPRKIMGVESQGMLLAADVNDAAVLLKIDEKYTDKIKPGTHIH